MSWLHHWRYQAMPDADGYLEVHEVYVDRPHWWSWPRLSWTADAVVPFGGDKAELERDLRRMLRDVRRFPVLDQPHD